MNTRTLVRAIISVEVSRVRQWFAVVVLGLILTGCSEENLSNSNKASVNDPELAVVKPMIIRGRCFGCHDLDEKRFGPAWRQVSARYKGQADARERLIKSVKNGSGGKWREVVGQNEMPANSNKLNDQDIGQIVDYILSL